MFTVYSLNGCPYSHNAEKLLLAKGIPAKIVELDQSIKHIIKQELGNETFPHIIYKSGDKDKPIIVGGFTELEAILRFLECYCSLKKSNRITDKMIKQLSKYC